MIGKPAIEFEYVFFDESHKLPGKNSRAPFYYQTVTILQHRNIVISEILKVLEDVILFSLSNYFLKFSNEYKKIHGAEQFDNDWYEYIEYGTTKQETILLQRLGFTRESATYIRTNVSNAIFLHEGTPYLNPILLESSNINVRKEANEIRYNVPEAFSMPLTPSSDTR